MNFINWINQSILRKLIVVIVIIVTVVFLILGTFITERVKNILVTNAQERIRGDADNISKELNTFFTKNGTLVTQMGTNQETIKLLREVETRKEKFNHPNFNNVVKSFKEIKSTDPNLALVWAGITKADDLVINDYTWSHNEDFDIESRSWYQKMVDKGELIYTNPYVDKVTGNLVISIVKPVYDDQKVVGNVGIDLMINKVSEYISNFELGKTGYAILISDDGTIVYHPDEEKILKENMTQLKVKLGELGKQMVAGESGIAEYEFEGVDKYFAFAPIKANGWSTGVMIDQEEVLNEVFGFRNLIALMFILGLVILVIVITIIIKKSLARIPDLLKKMSKLSKGNLLVTIDDPSKDEIGQISELFNKTAVNFKEIVTNIADSIEDISTYSEELSASAEEGNATIETTRKLVENISASIEEISASAEEVTSFAQESNSKTDLGNENIQKTLTSINKINDSTNDAVKIINKLDNNSQEIGSIIQMITNIAEQTNLLALNAAIEAARAGEAGQGFAVVAEEIRGLAKETNAATEEIAELIDETQITANNGLEAVKDVNEKTVNSKEVTARTEEIFSEIQNASTETSTQIEQTATATQNLAEKSEQVLTSTNDIQSMSDEIANSSQELSSMAQNLQSLVNKFKV